MSTAIALLGTFTALYACALATGAVVCVLRRHPPGPGCLGGAALLESTLAVRAALDGWALAAGAPVAEPGVHAGYLVASVALLPLLVAVTRAPGDRPRTVADAAVLAVGCATLVIVELRLVATGTAAGAVTAAGALTVTGLPV